MNELVKDKKSFRVRAGLTMLVTGILLMVLGMIFAKSVDKDKYEEARKLENYAEEYDISSADTIKISTGVGTYTVIFDENVSQITVNAENAPKEMVRVKQDGDEIKIGDGSGIFVINNIFNFKEFDKQFKKLASGGFFGFEKGLYGKAKVNIIIPAKKYEKIDIDGGAGELTVKNAECEDFTLDSGVGEVTLENIKAEKTDIDMGVGEITAKDCDLGKLDLDGGVGEANIYGKVGDVDIDGGVGEIALHINGSVEDYDIDAEDSDIHGYGSDPTGNKYKINIDQGLGDCDIYFE
ncbi:MAG: DUF4097 family beta strand repeat protein [Ruminococcus sp.]|nr:DUF4097 family beta strand repeat protein [Ruminococcus sp.]